MRFFRASLFGALWLVFLLSARLEAQKPELVVQLGHADEILSIAFSPDGQLLASGSKDEMIKLWNVAAATELHTFGGHSGAVHSVAFSPDGQLLASASSDSTVRLWEVASGRQLHVLSGHSGAVHSVAFSPDGQLLASASSDGTVRLWEVATRMPQRVLEGENFSVVAFSPNGRRLASGGDRSLLIWDVESGEKVRSLPTAGAVIAALAFSQDGKRLASSGVSAYGGGEETFVKIWDISLGQELSVFDQQKCHSLTFSPDGRTLASASAREIKLWDLPETGPKELPIIKGRHEYEITSLAFSPDGSLLASASWDRTVKLWDLSTGKKVHTFQKLTTSVAFSPDGRLLAGGGDDETVTLWEVATKREWHILHGHSGPVSSVAFSPDGSLLASASWDSTVKLWDVAAPKELCTFQGHSDKVTSVAFHPSGRYLVSASWDSTARLWDISSGEELLRLTEPAEPEEIDAFLPPEVTGHDRLETVAISPGGLFTGGGRWGITLWNIDENPVDTRILHKSLPSISIAFSPDSLLLVSGGENGGIEFWDVRKAIPVAVRQHGSEKVCIALSPDGGLLASGGMIGEIKLWPVFQYNTVRPKTTLKGHALPLVSLSYSPVDKRLASGGMGIRLWDLDEDRTELLFKGESINVPVALGPDGKTLASGSEEGIKLWDIPAGKESRILPKSSGRWSSLEFNPDGDLLISRGEDSLSVRRMSTGEEIRTFPPSGLTLFDGPSFDSAGRLMSVNRLKAIVLQDVSKDGEMRHFYLEDSHEVSDVKYSPDNRLLLGINWRKDHTLYDPVLGENYTDPDGRFSIQLWDALSGKELHSIDDSSAIVGSLVFSPDSKLLAGVGRDSTIKLWELPAVKERRSFHTDSSEIRSLVFSPDSKLLAGVDRDSTIKLWELPAGKERRSFQVHFESIIVPALDWDGGQEVVREEPLHLDRINALAFAPGGGLLAYSSNDSVSLIDITEGMKLRGFANSSGPASTLVFSPDGDLLAGYNKSTLRLWSIPSGDEIETGLFTLSGDEKPAVEADSGKSAYPPSRIDGMERVQFHGISPDGRILVSKTADHFESWDVATGKEIDTLRDRLGLVNSSTFAPDGNLWTNRRSFDLELQDPSTFEKVRTFTGHAGPIHLASFSMDGKFLATTSLDNTLRLWDVSTGDELRQFPGGNSVRTLVFSPDDCFLVSATRDSLTVRNVSTGQNVTDIEACPDQDIPRTNSAEGEADSFRLLSFGAEGNVLAGKCGRSIKFWDLSTGEEWVDFENYAESISSVFFTSSGQLRAWGRRGSSLRLWDVMTGDELIHFPEESADVVFSTDGIPKLTRIHDQWMIQFRDATTGEVWKRTPIPEPVAMSVFSQDGTLLAGIAEDSTIRLLDTSTGEELRRILLSSEEVMRLFFSADGTLLAGRSMETPLIEVWEVETGKKLHTFRHKGSGWSAIFTPDNRYLISESLQGTIKFWNIQEGGELATLVAFGGTDWAVVTPQGHFDASPGGMKWMHWVVGLEAIALEQLKERYYEPGLLQKLLGSNPEPLRDVSAFDHVDLYPGIELTQPNPEDPTLGIHLANRGGGIGRVVVLIDGKEISADARGPAADPDAPTLELDIDLKEHPLLNPGQPNTIEVKAYNAEGYLSSRGATLVYTPPGKILREKPELWAIVAGVSDYQGDALDLRYAAKDARDMATALQVSAHRLFGAEKVHLQLLTTDETDRSISPTRTHLLQAFGTAAQKANQADVLVAYLAGHGVTHGGQDGDFYYLTQDARSGELADPAVRDQVALSSRELTEYLKRIPARKQVLILDTCASGKVVEQMTAQRNVPSSQIRAMERMKDRTGLHVLTGCAADAVSYEASRYGQGLLTYSLLLGMRGGALKEDEFVDVSRLFQYAADQVPQLARHIGGIQQPVIAAPQGSSFDIGQVTREDQGRIPLAQERPLVVRASFQDEVRIIDRLGLTKQVNEALRGVSLRGYEAPLVFVDAGQMPEAYSLAGRYRVEGTKLTVTAYLFLDDQEAGQFSVTGDTADLSQVTVAILRETEELIALSE